MRGRSHNSRREAEGKDLLRWPGLNISALWSDSKSAKIRQQRFYLTTYWFRKLTLVE